MGEARRLAGGGPARSRRARTSGAGWGTPPWTLELELPRGPLPARCEVAVVGGGITGLSTALALAKRGVDVALFEADRIGAGASGRTGGLVLEHTSAGPLPEVGDCIPALERLLAEERIECELELPGCWELVHRKPGPEHAHPGWRDGDLALEVGELVPGGTLEPGKLLSGLARAAQRAGAALFEDAPVRRTEPGALWVGEQRVHSGAIAVCLNAYARRLVAVEEELGTALTLALVTEPLEPERVAALGLGAGHPFYTRDLPYLWGRPLGCAERAGVLFGGGLAFDPEQRLERIDVAGGEARARLDALEARIRALHPSLARVHFERRWGGPVAFRKQRVPILCRCEGDPDLIATGGYAGHGLALGVRLGELVARAVVEDASLPDWGRAALARSP